MARPFAKLRGAMAERDIEGKDIAKITGLETTAVSFRMTNKQPWKLCEMYAIMDAFNIPYSDMFLYFPKNGQGVTV